MIAVLNLGRLVMVVWIVYGLVLNHVGGRRGSFTICHEVGVVEGLNWCAQRTMA